METMTTNMAREQLANPEALNRPAKRKRGPRTKSSGNKLARLPKSAKVEKRPLHRPAIPSPYAGAQQEKVVYVSAKTPFISAIKRVEKLLRLAEKRAVQAATTITKQRTRRAFVKRGGAQDEILEIAEEVERQKGRKRDEGLGRESEHNAREEIVLKGTGKAIQKVLQMGLWFQQREEQYVVKLSTGSVMAIDDFSVDEDLAAAERATPVEEDVVMDRDIPATSEKTIHDVNSTVSGDQDVSKSEILDDARAKSEGAVEQEEHAVSGSRIRWLSVLEVAVSLR